MPKNKSIVRRTIMAYNKLILESWKQTSLIQSSVVLGTIFIFYIPPLIIAQLIGSEQTINLSNGWGYLLIFAISWLAGELLWRFSFFIMAKFEAKAIKKLYDQVLEEIVYKDLAFFSDRFAGSITKNLLAHARRFEGYFDTLTFGLIAQVGPIIFGLIVLTIISPVLSISLVALITLAILFVRPFVIRRSKMVKDREEIHATMSGHVSDVVSNIATVRAFGAETNELSSHFEISKRYADKAKQTWHYHNTRIDMVISPFYVLVNVFALAFILSTGIEPATKGALFLAFNYFMNISRFMWDFNGIYRRLEEALTDAALFIEYTDAVATITDKSNECLRVDRGAIEFNNVHFSHSSNTNDPIFKKFNLSITPGEKVGLVGHSGAGKSTLASLLLRFVDVDNGAINIDTQDIRDVTQSSLHHNIAYVPQEPSLFHRTLRENIAYGKTNATEAEIRRAAKQSHALEFIEKLPQGFDTLVGERGVKLSGGQRQRIAIARAILKDAPILILDEATSALDSESEKLIQASLETLMKGRTSIVIAHRLSTIAKLDRIIVLENGTIAEDGTHSDLLQKNGIYASLWNHQSGGFIEE